MSILKYVDGQVIGMTAWGIIVVVSLAIAILFTYIDGKEDSDDPGQAFLFGFVAWVGVAIVLAVLYNIILEMARVVGVAGFSVFVIGLVLLAIAAVMAHR